MRRWDLVALSFVGIALLWEWVAATLTDAAGWNPLVAPASALVPVAAFGWLRRGRDTLDIVAPAFFVAYAAYFGLAYARVWSGWQAGALAGLPPAVLFAGLPLALIMTVFVALPVALIPRRTTVDAQAHHRFWEFVAEQNAARNQPVGPP